MNTMDWVVIAGGVAAIALVNWWFFIATESARAVVTAAGQVINVVVKGGYSPATVNVKAGQPVRLIFDRQETSGCSEEVVIPDFGVRRYLAPHQKTVIEVTPERAGTYDFMCGMSMMRGRIIAE
jgi:plastocyanin domain-containing protein